MANISVIDVVQHEYLIRNIWKISLVIIIVTLLVFWVEWRKKP